jgi:antibiotic biosynthesis monooxygenase (ABM) superfamily enzyme
MTGKYILIAASETTPEAEEEYNRWYNDEHLTMLFEYQGLKTASRYRINEDNPDLARYLAVYEFETEEAMAGFMTSEVMQRAIVDFDAKWANGGFVKRWGASYRRLTQLER